MRHSITKTGRPAKKSVGAGGADAFRSALLAWYDAKGRELPWRVKDGSRADPYRVWLSEIMLQQTTVAAVAGYFDKFTRNWPTVQALAAAPEDTVLAAWAGLGYYARARNLHRCARIVADEHGGTFPGTEEELRLLPGIGEYTAAAIAAIAFGRPATVVDGNVERVVARWFGIVTRLPQGKKDIRTGAEYLSRDRSDRPGDFAQGMMDLGATICVPRAPRCGDCPVAADCAARRRGMQSELPYKAARKIKPQKTGEVYWLTDRRGRVFIEKRPARGLLAGMLGLPTSEWAEASGEPQLPEWLHGVEVAETPHLIRHSFTHFDLQLRLRQGRYQESDLPGNGRWIEPAEILAAGLPNLFLKCAKAMLT